MKISVIIPVYNVLPYLQRCLDSVKYQSLEDIEIIIVDDGSTDGSAEFVDEYAKTDSRIEVLHKENGGLMSAWTMGVRHSHGEYIGFVDSDDYISLQMYESMFKIIEKNNPDIVICNYSINHSFDGKLKTEIEEGLYIDKRLLEKIKRHILPIPGEYSIPLCRWNKLFKSSIVFECLKYTACCSRTFEDRYFVPATILAASSIYFMDDVLYYWMQRAGSNHGMYKRNLLEEIKRYYYIQQEIVKDYAPYLEEQWEVSFQDGIKQFVIRNILNINSFNTRLESSKSLFQDELVRDRLARYGKSMDSKIGKFVYFCFSINSPLLLAITAPLGRLFLH